MLTTQGPQRKMKSGRVDRTIENNFLILKIEKRNRLVVFDMLLSNPKQNKTKQNKLRPNVPNKDSALLHSNLVQSLNIPQDRKQVCFHILIEEH